MTEHLQLLLRKSGVPMYTSAEKEIVRLIKEKTCYVSLNPVKQEKEMMPPETEFILPDGATIKLAAERFRAPEILFNPDIIGHEFPGIHQVVVDSINKCDLDLRKSMSRHESC